MSAKVVVVGSMNMDLVIQAPRFPIPGETIIGSAFTTGPGGKGANQAISAARLGASVTMIGRVGNDDFGRSLTDNLKSAGVDVTDIHTDSRAATGMAFIVVADGGQNSIIVAPGANMCLTPHDIDKVDEVIARSDILLLQLEIPLDVVERAATIARAFGTRVLLNPAPARPIPHSLLKYVDMLVPNESEVVSLIGEPIANLAQADQAAGKLRSVGVENIFITLGDRGVIWVSQDHLEQVDAFEIDVVDTTAAGDAFVGAFAVAIAEGMTIPRALGYGNAAGALAVSRLGAQASLPTRSEVEQLLDHGQTSKD